MASNVSQVVLQARQDALKQGISEQLGKWGSGKISSSEFESRKKSLEDAYNSWYAGFLKNRGATPEETSQVRQSYAAQQVQVTEATAAQLLTDVVSGKISDAEYKRKITMLELGHSQRVGQIQGGTYDVFHYGSPISYRTSFSEAESTDTPTFRAATEAEKDAYGAQEASRLTEERGYSVGYDSDLNTLFWSSQDEDRYYAGRDPIYGDELHRQWEKRQLDYAKQLRQEAINAPDRSSLTTLRYETEEELDLRGFAEAEKMSEEKGVNVMYDPELNVFSWTEAPEKRGRIDTPLLGPKEGSVGYAFREWAVSTFDPLVRPTLEKWDDWLKTISQPSFDTSTLRYEKSMDLALSGKPWAGFALYGGSVVSYGAGSFFRAITTLVNPLGQLKGITSLASLTHPEYRSAFVSQTLQDPFKFSVGLGASILGGYTAGKLVGIGLDKISEYRFNKFLRDYPADDFLPYEQQFKFPQEVTILEDRTTLFKESVRVAEDLGAGFLDSKLVSRGSWPSKGMGYRRTGEGLVQEFIPEGMGHIETWIKPVTYKGMSGSTFLPGLRIDNAALFSFSSSSNLGLFTSIMGASSGLSIRSSPKLITESISEQEIVPDLKNHYKTWLKPVTHIDSINVSIPGLRTDVEPKSSLKQEVKTVSITSSIQNLIGKQTQDITQKITQIQIPKQILELSTKQTRRQKDIFSMGFGPTFLEGDRSSPFRIPNVLGKPKRRKRRAKDHFGWERREYSMRDVNTMFGGGRSRKKKGEGKRKKKKDILGGIVF